MLSKLNINARSFSGANTGSPSIYNALIKLTIYASSAVFKVFTIASINVPASRFVKISSCSVQPVVNPSASSAVHIFSTIVDFAELIVVALEL